MAAQRRQRRGRSEIALLIVCLALGVVALWGAGVLDSAIAREVRVSNAYVEEGVEIDEAEVEQIIGNRNLVVIYLDGELGSRGADVCDAVSTAADGTFVAIVDERMQMYGCSLLPAETESDEFATPEKDRLVNERLHIDSYERLTNEYVELNAEASGDEPAGDIDNQLDRIEALNEEATRLLTQRKYS